MFRIFDYWPTRVTTDLPEEPIKARQKEYSQVLEQQIDKRLGPRPSPPTPLHAHFRGGRSFVWSMKLNSTNSLSPRQAVLATSARFYHPQMFSFHKDTICNFQSDTTQKKTYFGNESINTVEWKRRQHRCFDLHFSQEKLTADLNSKALAKTPVNERFQLAFRLATSCVDLRWLWSSSNSNASRRKFFTVWPPSEIYGFLRLANPSGHPSQVREQGWFLNLRPFGPARVIGFSSRLLGIPLYCACASCGSSVTPPRITDN